MSSPFTSENLACIRDDVRRLVERTGEHQDRLQALVRAAEADAGAADASLSPALDGGALDQDRLHRLWCDHSKRSVEIVDAARQACVSAREEHVSALRLLGRVDDGCVEERQASAHGRAAVLVVDDVEDVRELIALVLEDAGFVVRTAANGLEALIAAYEMQPAVIVMDLMMPVLDGIEATRLIKASSATRGARVIAYTANASLPNVLAQKLFDAVLQKPAQPDVVVAMVQNAAGV